MINYDSHDDYLATLEAPQRSELSRIRAVVNMTAPDAVEHIGYGMPAFKYKNKPLFYYAAFKHHLSVFPTPDPTSSLANELKGYETSKGTIRFTLDHPLTDELVAKLVQARMDQIDNQR